MNKYAREFDTETLEQYLKEIQAELNRRKAEPQEEDNLSGLWA